MEFRRKGMLVMTLKPLEIPFKTMFLQLDCMVLYANFGALKVIVYILSVYLFLLCSFPCIQDDCGHDGEQTEQTSSNDHDEKEQDACTPFCIDKCCVAHVLCQPTQDIVLKTFSPKTVNKFVRHEITPSLRLHNIWQPPRA